MDYDWIKRIVKIAEESNISELYVNTLFRPGIRITKSEGARVSQTIE